MALENKDEVGNIDNAPDANRIPKAAQNVPREAVAVSHEKYKSDELGGGKRCDSVCV
jgi:hypothetical protein